MSNSNTNAIPDKASSAGSVVASSFCLSGMTIGTVALSVLAICIFTITPARAEFVCRECPENFYCKSAIKTACPETTPVTNGTGAITVDECMTCDARFGGTTPIWDKAENKCISCADDDINNPTWSENGCTTCFEAYGSRSPAWNDLLQTPGCSTCYEANGTVAPYWDGNSCEPCPSGSSWDVTSLSCICNPGYYGSNNSCTQCPANSYCTGGTAKVACTNATSPAGSDAAADCICNPGYYGSNNSCQICPTNHYCSGGDTISSCPSNKITTGAGFQTETACLCPTTLPHWNGNKCINCDNPAFPDWNGTNCICSSQYTQTSFSVQSYTIPISSGRTYTLSPAIMFSPKALTKAECEQMISATENGQKKYPEITLCNYETDYWAGAVKKCRDEGKRLPTMNEILHLSQELYNDTSFSEYTNPTNNGNLTINNTIYEILLAAGSTQGCTKTTSLLILWSSEQSGNNSAFSRLLEQQATYASTAYERNLERVKAFCIP